MKMQIGNNSYYSLQYEHIMKLSVRFRTNRKKYFFKQLIIKLWNLLLQDVMEAESINELKMWLDKFMDIPLSKAVKQKDAVSISDLGNLLAKIAGNLQGYIEEGRQRIFTPCEREWFFILVSLSMCTFSNQLQLDPLGDRILSNPLAWLIMALHNSYSISFLLSLYLSSVFITKPLD